MCVDLVILDACIGVAVSLVDFYPDSEWLRGTVHFYRYVFSLVPSTKVREIAEMLKAILAIEDRAAADEKARQVITKLRGQRLSRAAELVESLRGMGWTCWAAAESDAAEQGDDTDALAPAAEEIEISEAEALSGH